MSPKEARMEVIGLTDNHCRQCDNKCSRDFVYCWTKCEIGVVLGGKFLLKHPYQEQKTNGIKFVKKP